MDYLFLDWSTYHHQVFDLSQKIVKDSGRFDLIIAIARGGLTLGHLLSDFLGLPVASFTITSYHDLKQTTIPKIILKLGDKLHGKKILLVDDISDSGKTFVRGCQYLKTLGGGHITTASLLIKSGTTFIPNYYQQSVAKDTWVIFPYEIKETVSSLKKKLTVKELVAIGLPKDLVKQCFK
jgi:hypoxanthine phosphoribosyltransferase